MACVLEFMSELPAPAAEVWARATSFVGINAELMPLMRMTCPPGQRDISPESVVPGERLVRSWLLLFGAIPVDRSDVTLVELGTDYFRERSPMWSMRSWEHARRIEEIAGGCVLRDRLEFVPRLPGPLLPWFVHRLFRHRHARLRAMWAGVGGRLVGDVGEP